MTRGAPWLTISASTDAANLVNSATTCGVDTGGEYQSDVSLNSCHVKSANCAKRSKTALSRLINRSRMCLLHASPTFSFVMIGYLLF